MKFRREMYGMLPALVLAGVTGCADSRDGREGAGEAPPVSSTTTGAASQTPSPSPLAALEAESRRLFDIASSGAGDAEAEAEAKRSMDREDFRFFGYSFMTPGIFPAAYGVQCKPSVFSQPALVGPLFAFSDIAGEYDRQRIPEANFRRFGSVYNATILADPRFPHGDMCSAVPVGDARERPRDWGGAG